jgi:hypothetical protein
MYAEEVGPKNAVPAGHTIFGDVNKNKFVVAGPRATHAQCALEICPRLKASLACVSPGAENRYVGYGWIGLYQNPGADDAETGWDSWTSGCGSSFPPQLWNKGEPKWPHGAPERCAFATFHQNSDGSEFGGGIFSGPCWTEKPCICEYGTTTTAEYSSAADALIDEEKSWIVWQKDNKNFVAYSNVCMCVVCLGCILGVIYYFSQRDFAKDEVPEKAKEDIEAAEPEDKPILVVEPQTPSDKPSDKPILVDEVVPQTEAEDKGANDTDKDAAGAAAAEKDAVVQAAEQMDLESGRGDEGEQLEGPPRDITGMGPLFEESQVIEPPVVGTVVKIAEVTSAPEPENCSAFCLVCCNQSTSANVSEKQVTKMLQNAASAA